MLTEIRRTNLKIIDAHTHLVDRFGKPASLLINEMDAAGVDRAVAFAGLGNRNENEFVFTAAEQFRKRIIPFFAFDPRYEEDGIEELEAYVTKFKARGVKVGHKHANARYMYPMMEKAQEHGLIVAIHSDHGTKNHPYIIGQLFSSYPKVKCVILHMGGGTGFNSELLSINVAEKSPNVYLETSFVNTYAVKLAVERLGHERVLYGSDAGNGGYEAKYEKPGQYMRLMQDTVRLAGLPKKHEDMILGGNAARLLGIEA